MFEFFQAWLVAVGVAVAIFGAALAVLSDSKLFGAIHPLVDRAFWPAGPDEPARQFRSWVYGVVGGTMAGWGVSIAVLASQAFGSREAWAWWSITAALAAWFVLDTGRSLRHRVFANVAINSVLLVAVTIPLAATFGEFR